MLRDPSLKQWNRIVSAPFPHLSISQATGLSVWSFGMAMVKSSSLTRVSECIAQLNGERANTVRQLRSDSVATSVISASSSDDASIRAPSHPDALLELVLTV